MITCTFDEGYVDHLRHVVTHALVVKDHKILLGKRAGDILESGKWGIPGGFLNLNETASQGCLRELYEETGWEGKIISLFRINSKPNRPAEDRQNVVLEFLVEPLRKTGIPDVESSDIKWVSFAGLKNLGKLAFDYGESINLYLEYLKKPFPLPLVG
jgi:ADP-ribose pyrophosphatase YjhB (NUDIX family)